VPIQVTNLTKETVQLQPIENDFVAGDEKGTPAIILDQNSYAPTHSLKRFMVPLQNVTVSPNQTVTVTLQIKVPTSAQAGGYFGAVRFAPARPGTSSQVNLTPSVASLVLLTVPGPTTEQLNLTNFDIQQDGSTATNFRTPNDLNVLVRFQNKGNIQEAPYGQINVQKGKKLVYKTSFNQDDPKAEILPDSARRWTVPLKNLGKFGKYTITGTFSYGAKGQSIEVTKAVWIIPSTYIIGGLIAIAVIALLIVGTIFGLKAYKRRVLGSRYRRR
jgi:hypothetical protein